MSDETMKFTSEEEMVHWLQIKNLAEGDARAAAQVLYPAGFDEPDSLQRRLEVIWF